MIEAMREWRGKLDEDRITETFRGEDVGWLINVDVSDGRRWRKRAVFIAGKGDSKEEAWLDCYHSYRNWQDSLYVEKVRRDYNKGHYD